MFKNNTQNIKETKERIYKYTIEFAAKELDTLISLIPKLKISNENVFEVAQVLIDISILRERLHNYLYMGNLGLVFPKRQVYSDAVRQAVFDDYETGLYSHQALANRHKLGKSTIQNWLRDAGYKNLYRERFYKKD